MSASPIYPGRAYRVRLHTPTRNVSLVVLAGHGCDAICIALGLLGVK